MLFKEDLDKLKCDCPNCGNTGEICPMDIKGKCHPESPAWVAYHSGRITVQCVECNQVIADVAVASIASGAPGQHAPSAN